MAANPLTFLELEAFERKTLVSLSAWEADLIMRIDDAVLAAVSGDAPAKTSTGEPAPPTEASAGDPSSVKSLFRSLAARKAKAPAQT